MRPLHALQLALAVAQPAAGWLLQALATQEVLPLFFGNGSTTSYVMVTTTAPLTVSPTSTYTTYASDYIWGNGYNGENLNHSPINITIELFVLPNVTNLPVSSFSDWNSVEETGTASPTIETFYYAPVTLSNPATCTKTSFTYTDSLGVSLPDSLVPQATDSSVAAYVTTYVTTVSTDLGGQAVTTSRCDVYLNSQADPSAEIDGAEYYLTECVDPRRSTCSAGQNQQATGSGGCRGVYPTGAASNPTVTSTGSAATATKTGGATSLRGSVGLLNLLISVWALHLLV
ncbi:hypothetical protein EIK77_004402 [Talaromyces pinophilus]|uniref:Sequence orphan n=1 Tax=Talaromyces pinophilus TaxID=128442 RepID=A0A6V8HP50_TALPI|nr:hypothetical protein EIK77_004402 [Talaromyces pinophilus]PCG96724.1 hypothetical protein PENOC_071320 [Penicillium occitanis (nom. inval.)]PCG98588.1 Hypothetical protein PENO1_057440 [Penicillium occitanis (nom. inval.)]GAM43804.1 sequence orphan [Talaromyces pinophilus]